MKNHPFQGNQHESVSWLKRKWHNTKVYTKIAIIKTAMYIKRTIIVSSVICVFGYGYVAGLHTLISNADTKIVYVQATSTFPVMLTKICKAESGLHQFNSSGSVLRGKVNPSDIGYCQISEPTWDDQARKLGYDIFTEQGNKDMALWLYSNQGVQPWDSSKCTSNGWGKSLGYCN